MSPNYAKRTRRKVLMRPCLQSLRIPLQPCFLPHFMVDEPTCHHNYDYPEIYNISHCERPCCPNAYDPPENDINRSQQNEFIEENRVVELDHRVTRDGEENRDMRDIEPNENIQRHVNDPTNARTIRNQPNNNHLGPRISEVNNNIRNRSTHDPYSSRDDVRDIGTTAAPTTSCKGNQAAMYSPCCTQAEIDVNNSKNPPTIDNLDREGNGNNKSVDSYGLSLDRGIRQSKLTQANQPDSKYPMTEIESDNNINHRHINMPNYREQFPEENNEFSSQPEFFSPLATSSMHEGRNTGYITPPEYVNGSVRHPFDASNEFIQMSRPVQEDLVIHDQDCCRNARQNPNKLTNPRISNTSPHLSTRNILENRNPKYDKAERFYKDFSANQLNPDICPSNSRYHGPSNPRMLYANPHELSRNMPDNSNQQYDRAERCCIESSNIPSNSDIVPSYSKYPRPSNPQIPYANPHLSDPRSMLESRNPKYKAERCCEDSSINQSLLNLIPSTSKYPEAKNSLHERRHKYYTGSPKTSSNEEDSHEPTRRNIPEKRNTKYVRAESCCKDSGKNQSKVNRITSKSRYSLSKISLNGRQCYAGSPIVLSNKEDCCCKEGNDVEEYRSRFKKGGKALSNIVCNCPSDQLYGQVKSSDEPCDRIDATSCVSMSRGADQGPGCRCRYPPFFKQFNCAANINGSCNCSDNF